MSISFLFNGGNVSVRLFPDIGMLILYTYIGDYRVFSLRKMQKCWTLKFMWGKCSVMEKCIVSVWADEVIYLLILF